MRAVKYALSLVIVAAVAVVVIGVLLPSAYEIERSVVVEAPPEVVHALVDDLERWPEWQPLRSLDPTIHTRLGDTTAGPGASQRFTGAAGDGELTLLASTASEGVAYRMTVASRTTRGEIRFDPHPDGTEVVWTLRDDVGFDLADRYRLVVLDDVIGTACEVALVNLKTAAEATESPASAAARDELDRGS